MQLGKVVAFLLDLSSSWQPGASAWLRVCSVGSTLRSGCEPVERALWLLFCAQELGKRVLLLPSRQQCH